MADLLSLRAYAQHRGVALAAVQKAITTGRITTVDGKIDPEIADKQWAENSNARSAAPTEKAKPASAAADGGTGANYQVARAIREQFAARNAKLDYDERIGRLLDRDAVEKAAFESHRQIRDFMLAIPDRLAPILAAESDPQKVLRILDDEIRARLTEFADRATERFNEEPAAE